VNVDSQKGQQLVANEPVTNAITPGYNIVLPYGDQTITNAVIGDPEWVGVLERPDRPHASSNKFVARWSYVATPEKALDIASIHEQLVDTPMTNVGSNTLNLSGVSSFQNYDLGGPFNRDKEYAWADAAQKEKAAKQVAGGASNTAGNSSLYTRTFKVDPDSFREGLQNFSELNGSFGGGGGGRGGGGGGDQNSAIPRVGVAGGGERAGGGGQTVAGIQQSARDLFKSAGADLNAPGKSVFFNDRQGTLFVRGTLQDLDVIDQAVKVLNIAPPQVNIAAKFADVGQ